MIDDESDAKKLSRFTKEILNNGPGWRHVRDVNGSRREYVPLLEHPWPDWSDLRARKLVERLCRIYERPEYRFTAAPESATGSKTETPPPDRSDESSSAAERLEQLRRRRAGGSASSDGGGAAGGSP